MKKIIIALPENKNQLFKISYNGPSAKRSTAVLVYKWVERKINLASQLREKKAIVIKMGKDIINESCESANKKYLFWLTLAFLEDYLPKKFYLRKEKLYIGSEP